MVRDSSGFAGSDAGIFGLPLSFHLTIMVRFRESYAYRGAKWHPGVPALALRTAHGYSPCECGSTRSAAVRLLRPGSVQDQQLPLQKMPQAGRCGGDRKSVVKGK